MPLLTVTMPVYNAEATVLRAVRSTLRSMPKDSELVIFDDHSTDRSLEFIDLVRDQRIRVIQSDINVGGAEARNRLLAATDSEFVASMDADDVCLPWRFQSQLRALQKNDVVFGAGIRFGNGRRIWKLSSPFPLTPPESRIALLFHNPFFHPTLSARRSALDGGTTYRPMRVAQDYELWLRLARKGSRIVRLSTPVLLYRESPNQISQSLNYLERVNSSPELQRTYREFFSTFPNTPVLSRGLTQDDVRRIAATQLQRFSPLNRARYRRLLNGGRPLLIPVIKDLL